MDGANVVQSQDIIRVIALYAVYVFSAAVFVLFFVLVAQKLSTENRTKKKRLYRDKYIAGVREYLVGGKRMVTLPKKALEYEAFSEVCVDVLSSISGDIENKIKGLVKEISPVKHYKKMGKFSSWVKRFCAIEELGFFRLDELREYFTDIINREKNQLVKAKAAWALSLIADEKALNRITEVLSPEISLSSKFNEQVYANIIHSFKKKGVGERFISFLNNIKSDENVSLILKRDIIQACGSAEFHPAAKVIIDYFSLYPEDPQMKIGCIRALGRLGEKEGCKPIVSALTDDDWRVRAVSAQAATLCREKGTLYLQKLLYDNFYHVRINAAKTLAKFGEKGKSVLRSELNSKDRFVRDTVGFILEEVGRV